jgi:hypothetical protein
VIRFSDCETLLLNAVDRRKKTCSKARQEFTLVTRELGNRAVPRGFDARIRRVGRAYLAAIDAYRQALHNLEVFLMAGEIKASRILNSNLEVNSCDLSHSICPLVDIGGKSKYKRNKRRTGRSHHNQERIAARQTGAEISADAIPPQPAKEAF